MGIEPSQRGLTNPNPELEALRRKTVAGMAHWGTSGPDHRTCRECDYWTGCGLENGYYAKGGDHRGSIKPRCCEKFRELMGHIGEPVPHNMSACKYFEEAIEPPPIVGK